MANKYIKNRRAYPPAMKAAILKAVAAGQSHASVSRDFNLHYTTVRNWAIAAGLYTIPNKVHTPRMTLVTPARTVSAQPLRLTASNAVADMSAVTIHDENTISFRGQVFTR